MWATQDLHDDEALDVTDGCTRKLHAKFTTALEQIVDEAYEVAPEQTDGDHRLSMAPEALRDLAVMLTRSSLSPAALEPLWRHYNGRPYHRELMLQLAAHRLDVGENDQAIQLHRWLLDADPTHHDNIAVHVAIIDAHRCRDDLPGAIAALDRMIDETGPGSPWREAHAADRPALDRVDQDIHDQTRRLALEGYGWALRRRDRGWMARTEQLFARYLAAFPDATARDEMMYWHAEALYKLRAFDHAATVFTEVVNRHPDSPLARDAAVNAAVAIEDWLVACDPAQRDAWRRALVDLYDLIATRWPGDGAAPEAMVRAAALATDRAVATGDPDLLASAAERHERLAAVAADQALATSALIDAARLRQRDGDPVSSAASWQRLLDHLDGTDHTDPADCDRRDNARHAALLQLAAFHHQMTDVDTTIALLQRLVIAPPPEETTAHEAHLDAMWRLARLQAARGHLDDCTGTLSMLVEGFPEHESAPAARLWVGDVLADLGRPRDAAAAWTDLTADEGARVRSAGVVIAAQLRLGRLAQAAGSTTQAHDHFTAGVALLAGIPGPSPGHVDAAEMRLALLDEANATYAATSLFEGTDPSEQLRDKHHQMEQLRGAYLDIARDPHAGPWAVAAAYRAGQVVLELYDDLIQTPCPRNLDADQCSIYEVSIQTRAMEHYLVPTVDLYRTVLADHPLLCEHTCAIRVALEQLSPAEFPPTVEEHPDETSYVAPAWSEQPYAR